MGSWIAPEFVGDQSPRRLALTLQHFAKESLGSSLVPEFSDQDIQHIAILIHCSPQGELYSLNLHEEFVNMPGVANRPRLRLIERAYFRSVDLGLSLNETGPSAALLPASSTRSLINFLMFLGLAVVLSPAQSSLSSSIE